MRRPALTLMAILIMPVILSAQTAQLRVVRVFVYEITPALKEGPKSTTYSNMWLSGQIRVIYPKSMVVERQEGFGFFLDRNHTSGTNSSGDASAQAELKAASAAARKHPDGKFSTKEFERLSPGIRAYFTRRPIFQKYIVFNYDYYKLTDLREGDPISLCGIHCTRSSLPGTEFTNLPTFDCGTPYVGPPTNYFQLTPKGFVPASNIATGPRP